MAVLRRGRQDARCSGRWSMGWVEPRTAPLAGGTGLRRIAVVRASSVIALLEDPRQMTAGGDVAPAPGPLRTRRDGTRP